MTFQMKRLKATALGALMLATAPMAADALTVEFDDSSNGVGVDLTLSGTATVATSNPQTVGSYTMNIFTASSFDDPAESTLSSVALDVSGGDAGSTLTIRVSDTGFGGGAAGPIPSGLTFNVNGTKLGDTASLASYVDASNALFGTATQIGSTISATNTGSSSSFVFGGSETGSAVLNDPFSITQVITISASANKRTAFDADTIAAVPVPAAGLMLLTALGGLGGVGALRRRRKAA